MPRTSKTYALPSSSVAPAVPLSNISSTDFNALTADLVTALNTAPPLKLSDFNATTSAELAGVISDETGSGLLVFSNGPVLGPFTMTSVNKVAITAPASAATLTIPDGVTMTGPAASGTVMTLGNVETITGAKSFNSGKLILNGSSSGSSTIIPAATASGTITAPAGTYTLAGLSLGQTWSGIQTFTKNGLLLAGATSGTTAINATDIASGVITFPAATTTLVGKDTTDTFTNKTYDTAGTGNSFSINGVAAFTNTGTGAVARAASPVFTTPTLGAALATSINFGGTTLSNYVEGTWTPTIAGTSVVGTPTYTVQTGTYERIGRLVIIRFALTITSLGSASGNVEIRGLPLTSANTSNNYGGASFNAYAVSALAAGNAGLVGYIAPNTAAITVQQNGNTGTAVLTTTQLGASGSLFGWAQFNV